MAVDFEKEMTRMPYTYKYSVTVLNELEKHKSSVRSLVYNLQLNTKHLGAIYALVSKVLHHKEKCDSLLKKCSLMEGNNPDETNLLRTLVTDLLWGAKHLRGSGHYIRMIKNKAEELNSLDSGNAPEITPETFSVKYFRVNAFKTNIEEFCSYRQESNFQLIPTPKDYKQFLKAVRQLTEDTFIQDFHFPNLFVFFNAKYKPFQDSWYVSGRIALQNKSSLIAPFLLDVKPGDTVLDMCAAPGMKTACIAESLQGKGCIYAVDKSKERFNTMTENLKKFGASDKVKSFNEDVLDASPPWNCDSVTHILLDAPCSGSGMFRRIGSSSSAEDRLMKLQGLQAKLLKAAITRYTNCKRIVYSTCSINKEENEDVVMDVIKTATYHGYELVNCHDRIKGFSPGIGEPDQGQRCLYTFPDTDYTNGFFVAVFERKSDFDKNQIGKAKYKDFKGKHGKSPLANKKRKFRSEEDDNDEGNLKSISDDDKNSPSTKIKRKKNKSFNLKITEDSETVQEESTQMKSSFSEDGDNNTFISNKKNKRKPNTKQYVEKLMSGDENYETKEEVSTENKELFTEKQSPKKNSFSEDFENENQSPLQKKKKSKKSTSFSTINNDDNETSELNLSGKSLTDGSDNSFKKKKNKRKKLSSFSEEGNEEQRPEQSFTEVVNQENEFSPSKKKKIKRKSSSFNESFEKKENMFGGKKKKSNTFKEKDNSDRNSDLIWVKS